MRKRVYLFVALLVFTFLNLMTSGNFFFWDTILLGSKQAYFFYDNNFSKIILPDDIDSGHIPFFGFYLAILWKLLGKNLFVSHLAILPFTLGSVLIVSLLLRKFVRKYYSLALWTVVLDPTFVSQSTLVSPDILITFFFLLALYSIFSNKRLILSIAFVFLVLLSNRGAMLVAILYTFYVFIRIYQGGFSTKKFLTIFLADLFLVIPSVVVFLSYQIPHYFSKGWIGYNESFAWAESFEKSNFKEFIKGIIVWIWRLADFGRIFLNIALVIILIKKREFITKDKYLFGFIILLIIMTLGFSYSFLFFKGLRGHRYLLPMYFTLSFIFVLLLEKINAVAKYVYWIVILGLLTGHLWIYPDKIAQGWDCSLAHLPYYDLREQLVDYKKGMKKVVLALIFRI